MVSYQRTCSLAVKIYSNQKRKILLLRLNRTVMLPPTGNGRWQGIYYPSTERGRVNRLKANQTFPRDTEKSDKMDACIDKQSFTRIQSSPPKNTQQRKELCNYPRNDLSLHKIQVFYSLHSRQSFDTPCTFRALTEFHPTFKGARPTHPRTT